MSGELHGSFMISFRNTTFIRIIALILIGLAVLCGSALAHPPADVSLMYDDHTGDLVVAIRTRWTIPPRIT